jgi:hypothetical protein
MGSRIPDRRPAEMQRNSHRIRIDRFPHPRRRIYDIQTRIDEELEIELNIVG